MRARLRGVCCWFLSTVTYGCMLDELHIRSGLTRLQSPGQKKPLSDAVHGGQRETTTLTPYGHQLATVGRKNSPTLSRCPYMCHDCPLLLVSSLFSSPLKKNLLSSFPSLPPLFLSHFLPSFHPHLTIHRQT